METAKQIIQQLGGGRFVAMTGAKLVAMPKGLSGRFKGSARCNAMRITLNAMDTYDVKFFRVHGTNIKEVSSYDGIYCDQLQDIFTSETGLYTRLF